MKYNFFRNDKLPTASGFRAGARGTHSSRTIMLTELALLYSATGFSGDLKKAIVDDNALGKSSSSGRALSQQRLSELYCFDNKVPTFRIFRALCERDPSALPQLALLMAIARDPLLRASARPILGLAPNSELMRDSVRNAIASAVGSRMNEAVLNKVVRNTASSWTKTGHLVGRTLKRRARVRANQTAFAFALWIAQQSGLVGAEIFDNGWMAALDLDPAAARSLAERAHVTGLINYRTLGDGFELDTSPLERLN